MSRHAIPSGAEATQAGRRVLLRAVAGPSTMVALVLCLNVNLAGCAAVKKRTDNATVERGYRFDDDGKLTDAPRVSVPLFGSGVKEKPRDVTPDRQ